MANDDPITRETQVALEALASEARRLSALLAYARPPLVAAALLEARRMRKKLERLVHSRFKCDR